MEINSSFNPVHERWEYETVPEAVPSAPEQVADGDVHLLEIHLVGSGAVTVVDGNGNSVVPPGTTGDYLRNFDSRLCPGGVTWSATGEVVGYLRWF